MSLSSLQNELYWAARRSRDLYEKLKEVDLLAKCSDETGSNVFWFLLHFEIF